MSLKRAETLMNQGSGWILIQIEIRSTMQKEQRGPMVRAVQWSIPYQFHSAFESRFVWDLLDLGTKFSTMKTLAHFHLDAVADVAFVHVQSLG